jgi:hypothetical protein
MRHEGPWVVEPDDDGIRPAGPNDACFYCRAKIGDTHGPECAIPIRTVVVKMEIEYTIDIPEHWDVDMLHFHRNDGSWCSNNGMYELDRVIRHRYKTAIDASGAEPVEGWEEMAWSDLITWLDACWHTCYSYVREATAEDEQRDGVRCPATAARRR